MFEAPAGGIRAPRPQYLMAGSKAGAVKAREAACEGLALTVRAASGKNEGARGKGRIFIYGNEESCGNCIQNRKFS